MMAIVFSAWPLRRSGCHAVHPVVPPTLYCAEHSAATAPPVLSTVKPSPDPLRTDPVATVVESCVGCGLCGEVAHAAVLCPSFYRVELIRNPSRWDRLRDGLSRGVIRLFGGQPRPSAP